jgi:YD repeat-containing protein
MLMYDDDGSLRQILVDSVFYQEDGSFLRTEFWVQDFARGQESLQPNGVTYVDRIAADGSEVTITESPDGEPVSRATRWYDNEPSEMSRLVRERWANGSWTQESRTLILERDPAGKVLLRRTEEWVDGAWRLNLFYDQVERDPSGRVVSAYEKGERPVTFTYAESGLLVEKTEGRLGEPQSRWRYEHADVQGR